MLLMIEQIEPLAVGNAVQIAVQPPETALRWRVLRNTTGVFPAFDDPASILIRDVSSTEPGQFIDYSNLVNGTLYYYQAFYWDGSAWSTDAPVGVTPATTYQDDSVDPLSIMVARMQAGINAEVARNALKPTDGKIAVLSAPPVFEDTRFPVVSVHLQSEAPMNRALGEEIANDTFDNQSGLFDDHEGWVAKTQLQIVGWSLNADERIELRKAIRRIILANLAVFEEAVMMQIEFSQQDVEDFTTYSASVYETVGTFSCMTPLSVNVQRDTVADVVSTVTPIQVEVTL